MAAKDAHAHADQGANPDEVIEHDASTARSRGVITPGLSSAAKSRRVRSRSREIPVRQAGSPRAI